MRGKLAIVLLVSGVMLVTGCQSTGGYRSSSTAGLQTTRAAADPLLALSHKATLDYWNAVERTLKRAKQAAPGEPAITTFYRYASGMAGLHAGQGGMVEGPGIGWTTLRTALVAVEPKATGRELIDEMAALHRAAAKSIVHDTKARERLERRARFWQTSG